MNKPTPEQLEELKKLPQKALRQIRALAKGNGVEPDSIQIKHAGGEIIYCEAISHIELHPEIIEEKKRGRLAVGKVLEDPAQAQKAVQDMIANNMKNDETRKYLANILLDRPDKGYAIHAEYFDVEPLNHDFCYHAPCESCAGNGNVSCKRCGGQRREVCNVCHGRTMIACKYCHGSGMIQGADGKQTQCNRCFGARQIACTICQKTGTISCRQCKGSGTNQCNTCKGGGFFTHITHVILKMKTLFEIDRAALPHPAVKIIEDNGWKMAANGHIKLTAKQVKREDGGLAIQYNTEFPYGDLEVSINGKPLKTHLFGYKGKMLKLPNFLDNIIEQNFTLLAEAANGSGNVASKVRKASKTRLISEALTLSLSHQPKKAMMGLKKKYPFGASNQLIKNAIVFSNKALANVTRKTRFGGLGLGMFISAVLYAGYFFDNTRSLAENTVGNPTIIAVDIALVLLGGFITHKCVGYMAKRPLKNALGNLMPETKRGKFKPKNQGNIYVEYGLSIIVFVLVIYIAKMMGVNIPSWFPF